MVISQKLLIGGCLLVNCALAQAASPNFFPTAPGVSAYGFGGNGWTAIGDALVPVVGQPLNFTFLDPQAYYHSADSEASGSLGLGQRWLTPQAGILGAYVFGDYNNSADNRPFWFVSPGIERLGETFDFSLNGYIPVSSQRKNTGAELGDQVHFSGHSQFDEWFDTFESTGWGGDVQVGVRLPFRNSRVILGAYYFDPKDQSSITGATVRAEVPVNRYLSLEMSEAYDSHYHNTLKGGFSIALGGRTSGYGFHGDLTQRLVDPIQRNLIAVAGGAHNAQPILSGVDDSAQLVMTQNNISFFVPEPLLLNSALLGAVVGDGTYENPYRGMTQDNVTHANTQNNRIFYVNSGLYQAAYNPAVNPDFIVLDNDQLFGRQNYFAQPAQGAARPDIRFTDAGFLMTSGAGRFTSLQLTGEDTAGTAGIFIDHETGGEMAVTMANSTVSHFGNGIDIYTTVATPLSFAISNSVVSDNSNDGVTELSSPGYGGGVAALNAGPGLMNITVTDSNLSDNPSPPSPIWGGVGVFNTSSGDSFLSVNSSTLDNITSSGAAGGGVALDNEGTGLLSAQISHSELNGGYAGVAIFNNLFNSSTNRLNVSVQDSVMRNNSEGVFRVYIEPNNSLFTLDINRSVVDGSIQGIHLYDSGNLSGPMFINISHSTISNNSQGISFTPGEHSDVMMDINDSEITDNTTGILFDFVGPNNVTNINHSTISNNGTGLDVFARGNFDNAAGVVNVNQSFITNNNVGVFAHTDNNANSASTIVNINESTVSGNNTPTLSAIGDGVSTINVTNPVSFDGIVQFSGTGLITFPDVTPSSGDHVVCTPAGCSIVP